MIPNEKTSLVKKLFKIQSMFPRLAKTGFNPHFKSNYVDLNTILEELHALLKQEQVLMVQTPGKLVDGIMDFHTKFYNVEGGESIEYVMSIPVGQLDPQKAGSAITYARRYHLVSIFGLIADNDDDGNAASGREKPKGKKLSTLTKKQVETLASEKSINLTAILAKKGYKTVDELDDDEGNGLLNWLRSQ